MTLTSHTKVWSFSCWKAWALFVWSRGQQYKFGGGLMNWVSKDMSPTVLFLTGDSNKHLLREEQRRWCCLCRNNRSHCHSQLPHSLHLHISQAEDRTGLVPPLSNSLCAQALADAHSKIVMFPSAGWRTFQDYDVSKHWLMHILWLWHCPSTGWCTFKDYDVPKHWLTHIPWLWRFSFALLIRPLSLKIAFY